MNATSFRTHRRIPALAALAMLALAAAALVFMSAPAVHGQVTKTAAFGPGDGIDNRVYTAGTYVNVNHDFTSDPDGQGLTKLPEVTVTFNVDPGKGYYEVAYTATGLPDGIRLDSDRIIRGTPEAATNGTVTVTYTATVTFYTADESSETSSGSGIYSTFDNAGTATASLTFRVAVAPPVTFGAEAMKFINSRIIAWKSGSGWLGDTATNDAGISVPTYVSSITLPEATGGSGTRTYKLLDNSSGNALSSEASGITFNTSTRALGGTPAAAQKTWAVTLRGRGPERQPRLRLPDGLRRGLRRALGVDYQGGAPVDHATTNPQTWDSPAHRPGRHDGCCPSCSPPAGAVTRGCPAPRSRRSSGRPSPPSCPSPPPPSTPGTS